MSGENPALVSVMMIVLLIILRFAHKKVDSLARDVVMIGQGE